MPKLSEVRAFPIFSKSMLYPLTANWKEGFLTIRRDGKAIMVLEVDDARELIDALQKFVVVSE